MGKGAALLPHEDTQVGARLLHHSALQHIRAPVWAAENCLIADATPNAMIRHGSAH